MQQATVTFQPRRVLADYVPTTLAANVLLVVGAAFLVGLLAQVSIPLGFTPVPITGQTLGVLLASSALGWRRASLAMGLYAVAGMAGLPWFAGHSSGFPVTLGYIVGFIFAGSLLGWLASRGIDRKILHAAASMILAEVVIYVFGIPWLAVALHCSLSQAFWWGMWPFLIGDTIKAALAGVLLPSAWHLVDRVTNS